MRTLFDYFAFVEDDDSVGLEDGVEAVGDGDGGASVHQLAGGFFEQGFGFGVERGGGFIQDEDGGVFEEGAGEGETLGLSAGETGAAFANDGFIFFRQGFNEIMQARGFGGLNHFCVGRVRFAEADVFGDGGVEEVRFLRNPSDVGLKVKGRRSKVAFGRLNKAEEKLGEGGFACAGFADEGDVLSLFDCQVDVLQGGGVFVGVGIRDIR